jgi:hypothetical protein
MTYCSLFSPRASCLTECLYELVTFDPIELTHTSVYHLMVTLECITITGYMKNYKCIFFICYHLDISMYIRFQIHIAMSKCLIDLGTIYYLSLLQIVKQMQLASKEPSICLLLYVCFIKNTHFSVL